MRSCAQYIIVINVALATSLDTLVKSTVPAIAYDTNQPAHETLVASCYQLCNTSLRDCRLSTICRCYYCPCYICSSNTIGYLLMLLLLFVYTFQHY